MRTQVIVPLESKLDDLGFIAAVQGLTSTLEEQNIEVNLNVSGTQRRLPPEMELTLFRITQESLNNVRQHVEASRVVIEVLFRPHSVHMSIEDDSRGFNAPDRFIDLMTSSRLGLIGMYERARILGGTLQLQSTPGESTRVSVDVPDQA